MFNLETAIVEWRTQLLAAGIKTPVPLEELESHLCDEIERQVQSGLSEQRAFEISVQRVGQPKALDNEFKKSERTFMNQTAKTGAGMVGLLAGMVGMTPGTVQMQDEMVMANGKLGLWLIGRALVGGSVIFLQRMFLPRLFKVESENAELTPMKQAVKTGAGITVLLIGMALLLPVAAQAVQEGVIKFEAICFLVFGIALLITGGLVAFCPYKKRVA